MIISIFSFLFASCDNTYDEIRINDENISTERYDFDIISVHDDFCDMLCNSLNAWRSSHQLDVSKIDVLWDAIVSELAELLDLSANDILIMFDDLGINSSNYTTIYEDKYHKMDLLQRSFLDDLESTFIIYYDSTDLALLNELENKRVYWQGKMEDYDAVNLTIDIARSSMIYWKNNFETCILSNGSVSALSDADDDCRKRVAAEISLGDVTGGLWGAFGGLAGATLGAVGGTLGAAIGVAVFGKDCDEE